MLISENCVTSFARHREGEIYDRTEKHRACRGSGWYPCAAFGLCGFRDASYRSYAERTVRGAAGAAPALASRLVSRLGPPTRLAPAWLAPLVNSDEADTAPPEAPERTGRITACCETAGGSRGWNCRSFGKRL